MILDLNKEDLIALVKGQFISYSAMEIPELNKEGSFSDSRGWSWDYGAFSGYSELELFDIYTKIKIKNEQYRNQFNGGDQRK